MYLLEFILSISKELSICLYQQNDLGFRPNTQSTNYAVKPIFPGKWLCKLILSVGFVLLSGNFDRKRDRERGEFFLKNDFLDISTCINALSLWATIEWTSTRYGDKTQLHENCSEPAGSDLPQTREMVHWQVLPPPAKAGQAGQVLLQCWKLILCEEKPKMHLGSPESIARICHVESPVSDSSHWYPPLHPGMQMLSLPMSYFPKRKNQDFPGG